MISLEQARGRILEAVTPLGRETSILPEAAGRILAERTLSPTNLPGFDNSAMDGYAVRALDVAEAGVDRPVRLRVIGRTEAGAVSGGLLTSGAAVRVFTGAALPEGADAVVMQEDTRIGLEGFVEVLAPVEAGEHVRFRGSDLRTGALVGDVGQRLTAGRLALLGAIGQATVQVGQIPVVSLLATGSELVEGGQVLRPGQIYESNRIMLAALVAETGALPRRLPIVPDNLEATAAALAGALRESEVVITSGGVSVGETDHVKAAWEALGGRVDLWKVAVRPGKPFVFGRWRDRFLFGLPGNPASALVTFLLLVRPALLRLMGARDLDLPVLSGVLGEPLENRGDRRHFLRVRAEPGGVVRLAGGQGSHAVACLASATGLVDVPPQTALAAGSTVTVLQIPV